MFREAKTGYKMEPQWEKQTVGYRSRPDLQQSRYLWMVFAGVEWETFKVRMFWGCPLSILHFAGKTYQQSRQHRAVRGSPQCQKGFVSSGSREIRFYVAKPYQERRIEHLQG
jgi:hypothetical protein